MQYRYHHVHIICSDLARMISFFEDALGATLVKRHRFGPADGAMLDLDGTPVFLRVARDDETVAAPDGAKRFGWDHLGIATDDIHAAQAELSAKGAAFIVPPTDVGDGYLAFFKGPDDLTFELWQDK